MGSYREEADSAFLEIVESSSLLYISLFLIASTKDILSPIKGEVHRAYRIAWITDAVKSFI